MSHRDMDKEGIKWRDVGTAPQPKTTYSLLLQLDERNKELETQKMIVRGLRADLSGMCNIAADLRIENDDLKHTINELRMCALILDGQPAEEYRAQLQEKDAKIDLMYKYVTDLQRTIKNIFMEGRDA